MCKWILASLLLVGAAAQGQTIKTEWNGHAYEVIWFPQEFVDTNVSIMGWWARGAGQGYDHIVPEFDAPKRGGHVLTVTSAEEQAALHALWPQIEAVRPERGLIAMRLGIESIEEAPGDPGFKIFTIHWQTGEISTLPPLPEHVELSPISSVVNDPAHYPGWQKDPSDGDGLGWAWPFYILEIDPPNPDKDSDGDGIKDENEKNTRHHYEFVQVPDPWDGNTNPFGGWTYQRCETDAFQRGGHIVHVSPREELSAIVGALVPWVVRDGNERRGRVPTSSGNPAVEGAIVSNTYPNIFLTSRLEHERFSTYILEIENSTDPNDPDTDDDGFNDGDEVAARSNPLDPKDVPEVIAMQVFPALEVEIPTTAGIRYQLQTTSALASGIWTPLGEPFLGTGQPHSRFVQARAEAAFLRAVVVR